MSTYGFDEGFNRVVVPTSTSFDALSATVATKQDKLNSTQGEDQTDCNELTDTGIYYIPVTAANKPSNTTFTLLVFPIDDEGTQISQIAMSSGGTLMFTRVYSAALWSPWAKWLSSSSAPASLSGETVPSPSLGKNGDTYYQTAIIDEVTSIISTFFKMNSGWIETHASSSGTYANYSTTEHAVGTWTDGSVLYEQTIVLRTDLTDQYTFTGTSLAVGGSYAVGLTGVANLWLESYSAIRGKTGNTDYTDIGLTEDMVCVYNHTDGSFYVRNTFEPTSIVITVRYTKTST